MKIQRLFIFFFLLFQGCNSIQKKDDILSKGTYSNLREYFSFHKLSYPVSLKNSLSTIPVQYKESDDTLTKDEIFDMLGNDIIRIKELYYDSNQIISYFKANQLNDMKSECGCVIEPVCIIIDSVPVGMYKSDCNIYLCLAISKYCWNSNLKSEITTYCEQCKYADTSKKVIEMKDWVYFRLNRKRDSLVFSYWEN